MMARCKIDAPERANTSHSVALVPRLEHSVAMLGEIVGILGEKHTDLQKSNGHLVADFVETDKTHVGAIKSERTVAFSLETLSQTGQKILAISGIDSIPEILTMSIPVLRTVSAQLFDVLPDCSQTLSELSVCLGSVVLDSAVLTTARFDFGLSNKESSDLLDKVKLTVDSKLSKRYPNLDFFKLCDA